MISIAKEFDISSRTVQNINKGLTHYDESETYPLRITGRMISQLKDRLSRPNESAVPNPHILSPQLLDYIGFLSILEVGPTCIITFKSVFNQQLEEIFKRELTDVEILSIIELRPQRPAQLKEMVNAYYDPKVRLTNVEYWIKTGFIKREEKDMIYSLLVKR